MNASLGLAAIWISAAAEPARANPGEPLQAVTLLCDPSASRLSVRTENSVGAADGGYKRRRRFYLRDLVVEVPQAPPTPHYQQGRVRHARCGPLTVRLAGDFLNANRDGEMGAIDPFVSVAFFADGRKLFPLGAGLLHLAPCDIDNHMWRDCPAAWAVRIDLAYGPATGRLTIREWVDSGDVIGGEVKRSERVSSVRALPGPRRQGPHRLRRH
jgi:hypothetical protein